MLDGYTYSAPFKKKTNKNDVLVTKQKASVADGDQYIPDALSPTGSVSSVCISGRRRHHAAPDDEDGTLFLQTAKRK